MKFRPCIDLHNGVVRQIVGSTLSDAHPDEVAINFTADKPPAWFAGLYRSDDLTGGHVIKLGPGNDHAAMDALAAYPGGLQIGGGITAENAAAWLDMGASHVIVTSYVFSDGRVDFTRLAELVKAVGRKRLVLDLSCRKKDEEYYIVTDRWQTFTREVISAELLETLALSCDEFLVHGADVEGKCAGVESGLVQILADWSPITVTYAGGIRDLSDMQLIRDIGRNRIDATVGSGLDIFGGTTAAYKDMVAFCRSEDPLK
ncbi:MAG: phosphoribosylformimino-5-aminoimidazole carboxamide ribotide isomerase [Deltaproteobacteria bacterium]|nr:phosphoribosylformimino-5-aminoimidazole carboxamide ribotide isomerase [Deltaproteobacteria bacterium]MBW2659255.1 phosphoribosylformimino-5-aminoimidazole carboxamide ribotide isomerase [Deltaproteobacteria bacterium]